MIIREPISSAIISNSHIVISIINGFGDSFLALPVIRYLINKVGGDHITIWAPLDIIETVFYGLNCDFIPIHFDRYNDYPFYYEEQDFFQAKSILENKTSLLWIGLNAYYPLWPLEKRLRDSLNIYHIWDFGDRPELYSQSEECIYIRKHMAEQYWAVIGEESKDSISFRKLKIDKEAREKAEVLIDKIYQKHFGYIAIHTDSVLEKLWTTDAWLILASLLANSKNIATAVLGKPSKALAQTNSCIYVVSPCWHLQTLLLEKSMAFVGIDSCWAHVANALGIPGVVLFGNDSSVDEWGPKGNRLSALSVPNGLNKLSAEQVYYAIKKWVG